MKSAALEDANNKIYELETVTQDETEKSKKNLEKINLTIKNLKQEAIGLNS